MFANPIAPAPVLLPRDILRFLRLIASSACRDEQHVPLSAGAALCGMSRLSLYRMLWPGRVSDDLAELPMAPLYEAGKLRFRRSGPRSREPNHWEIIER